MKQKVKSVFEIILLDSILNIGYSEDASVGTIRELANEVIQEQELKIDLDDKFKKSKHEKIVKKILLNIYNKLDKIPENSIWYDNGIEWTGKSFWKFKKN